MNPDYIPKIYRLLVGTGGHYYIGSTVLPLNQRYALHKYASKGNTQRKLYDKVLEVGWDNVTIEVVEHLECNSFEELHLRENTHIDMSNDLCLNMRPARLTEEERSKKAKEHMVEWRRANAERVAAYNKQYKANRAPLTEEEIEHRRAYHREYQRRRRAAAKLKKNA